MNEFTHEKLAALVESIPVGATKSNASMKVLAGLSSKDMTQARGVYFAQDRLDIWETLRPHPDSSTATLWVRQNLEHALQHCPLLMNHWAQFSQENAMVLADEVGKFIDNDPTVTDQERLAILRGEPCAKYPALGGLFRLAVVQDPEHFSVLSPAWLGANGSELRQEAVACGWEPESLARMCRLHADTPNAKAWTAQWPFPYTLMLLDYHVHGMVIQEFRDARNQSGQWPVAVDDAANPGDVVLARAVLPYLDASSRNYTLSLPATLAHPEALLPPGEVSSLTQLVDVHMGLGMAETLLNHFSRQSLMPVPDANMLGVEKPEGFVLPEMGSP